MFHQLFCLNQFNQPIALGLSSCVRTCGHATYFTEHICMKGYTLSCKCLKTCLDMSDMSSFTQKGADMSRHRISNVVEKDWFLWRMSCRKKKCLIRVGHVCRQYQRHISLKSPPTAVLFPSFFWRGPHNHHNCHIKPTDNRRHKTIGRTKIMRCPFGTSASFSGRIRRVV